MNRRSLLMGLFFFLFRLTASGQSVGYQFVRYSAEKGLSHNEVNCFLRDRQGFTWMGTAGGLNRFDGYTFKVFRYDSRDSTSLSDNNVSSLFEDEEGLIWISTRKGFNIFDPVAGTLTRNADKIARNKGLPDAGIDWFVKGRNGDYWLLHKQKGLLHYQAKTRSFTQVNYQVSGKGKPEITDCQQDSKGFLWVIHRDGSLLKLDPVSHRIVYLDLSLRKPGYAPSANYRLFVDSDCEPWVYVIKDVRGIYYFDLKERRLLTGNTASSEFRLSNNIISSLIQADDGTLWVGTDHGGINLIDKRKRSVSYLSHNPNDPKSISQNSITALYKDPTGMIWAGTFKRGFFSYHRNVFKFSLFRHQASNPSSLPFDDVNVFVEDKKGNLWIGTNGGGLIYYDREQNRFRQYLHKPGDQKSLSNNVIVSLCLDRDEKLWIGTYFGGLNCFDGREFKHYRNDPTDTSSLIDDRVWELLEDKAGNLWVGTLGGGLDVLDRSTGRFRHHRPLAPNSVRSAYISALHQDKEGNIWVGTGFGIDVLEQKTGKFVHYGRSSSGRDGLSSDAILSLAEDRWGNMWIGTSEGLNYFDKRTRSFRVFDSKDGMPDNSVLTIAIDANQDLWMGTPKGLVYFKVKKGKGGLPERGEIEVFNELDGLQGRSFNENAVLRMRSGELVFGGANGFTIFSPAHLAEQEGDVPLVLTDFQIFTKSVLPGEKLDGRVVLSQAITATDHVTLAYRQNVFSIEFAALNYLHPDKNNYLYTLEGFTNQWFQADNASRKVTYTNLDPGEYRFKVKRIAGSDHKEGKERILTITILPPFWRTNFAYFLYFVLIAGALVLARWILLERERMNFRIEQERREAQQLHELDLMKIKFFTNISHEFRTPLTLILTPLESLLAEPDTDGSTWKQLNLIHRNAKRLLNLVTQLLDFKKMEVQETEFSPTRGDVIQFLREIALTFSDLSDRKHIRFSFHSSLASRYLMFDQDKLSRILYNLLSNAFKFTPAYGDVTVEVEELATVEGNVLQVSVRDSGIGIPEKDIAHVFERFYQHELPNSIVNQGSGIGLAITREFVKLHGGMLTVESIVGEGSLFMFTLPLPAESGPSQMATRSEPEFDLVRVEKTERERKVDKSLPKLLLVEDNEDFRTYLHDALKDEYQIVEAGNGNTAFTILLDWGPDLVVSDVMMPEMDGIELCRKIKTDPRVSHIPVILLTARVAEEQQLQGYETGADAYVTKPFRLDILRVRIRNLVRQREQLQSRFQRHIAIRPSEVAVLSMDEQFVMKAVKVVEENIANAAFSVEDLSSEMAMSRVYLYKKILALTGKTPLEFIRIIRLRRAASLLEKSQLSVAEIAYSVGFNNPKYFARYFKEEFNQLPSEYGKEKGKKTS